MFTRYQFCKEQITELNNPRKRNKNKNVEKRIKTLLLYATGEKRDKIAEQTGYAKSYITELVTKYRKNGLSAISGENYKGNNRN